MNILSLCDNGDVLSVFRIVNIIIMIIKVAVPILLIIVGMVTLMKSIKTGNEDLLAKAKKQLVSNCIAAVIIFLVPTLINVLARLSSNDGNSYLSCLKNATIENINQAYITQAEALLASSEENLNYNGYYSAVTVVSKIKDTALRKQYNERLATMYKAIEEEIKERNEQEKTTGAGGTSSSGAPLGDGTSFPTYTQCDTRWGNKSYQGTNLCNAGCGYTSLAMVLSGIKRDPTITPYSVHEYIYGNGISINHSGGAITDVALYDNRVASHYGVKIEVLFGRDSVGKTEATKRLVNALNQGKKVVLLRPGHYIALSGTGSQIEVHDPAWSSKNGVYDIDGVFNNFCCDKTGNCKFVYAVAYS